MNTAALAVPTKRDYSLIGRDARLAVESGLAAAEWYHTDIPRKQMKELMKRSDGPAIRDTAIWLGSMVVFAGLGVYFWGSWLCVPFFLAYGVLYGSASDSRWHECGHGTAFKTRWMNDVVYQIACFMIMRNPVTWRWSHTRHHTDTVIVGRDPEIAVMRPPDLLRVVLNFFGILDVWHAMGDLVRNTLGIVSAEEKTFIPEQEQPRVVRIARIWAAIYAITIGLSIYTGIDPATRADRPAAALWRLASCLTGLLQHGGLADNVTDHRLEQPDRSDEPDQPVHLLEHELPRRTPHVPDGALSRAAAVACHDQTRSAGGEPVYPARLPRDGTGVPAPVAQRGLFPQARIAADS